MLAAASSIRPSNAGNLRRSAGSSNSCGLRCATPHRTRIRNPDARPLTINGLRHISGGAVTKNPALPFSYPQPMTALFPVSRRRP